MEPGGFWYYVTDATKTFTHETCAAFDVFGGFSWIFGAASWVIASRVGAHRSKRI